MNAVRYNSIPFLSKKKSKELKTFLENRNRERGRSTIRHFITVINKKRFDGWTSSSLFSLKKNRIKNPSGEEAEHWSSGKKRKTIFSWSKILLHAKYLARPRNARYARPLRARHLHTDDRALERRRLHIFARRVCERSAGGEAGSTPVYFSISRLFPFKW